VTITLDPPSWIDMRRIHAPFLVASVLVGSLVSVLGCLLAGCGEYCEYSETTCDRGAILGCIESDGFADHTFGVLIDACEVGETCVDTVDGAGMRNAVCSFTGIPDPRCSPEGLGITRVCADDKTAISCSSGYASQKRTCEGACVAPHGGAFCSVDEKPSPTCAANEACEPGAVVECREGYVIDRIACEAGDDCVRLSGLYRRAYCASFEECDGTSTWCEIDVVAGQHVSTIRGCAAGRIVEMTCNEGSDCETFGVLGYDHRPTGETQAQCIKR
jgi:hypothetical protein